MSIVIQDKARRKRLALHWPFSRQITLSIATVVTIICCGGGLQHSNGLALYFYRRHFRC